MKLFAAAALALAVSTPALATPGFTVTFEKAWDFGNGAVDGYYNGGTAADGTTGPNLGVGFVGISGFTNDALGPYYANAPSPLGTAYAFDTAYINIASGVNNALRFFYSSPVAVTGALRAYSGLNGGGTLLASFNLAANDLTSFYDTWSLATFSFGGTARSFDLSNSASAVLFDNISAVPEPGTMALLFAGGAFALSRRRRS